MLLYQSAVFQTGNELFTDVEGKSVGKVVKIFSNKMNVEAQRQLNARLFWLSYYLLRKRALDATRIKANPCKQLSILVNSLLLKIQTIFLVAL